LELPIYASLMRWQQINLSLNSLFSILLVNWLAARQRFISPTPRFQLITVVDCFARGLRTFPPGQSEPARIRTGILSVAYCITLASSAHPPCQTARTAPALLLTQFGEGRIDRVPKHVASSAKVVVIKGLLLLPIILPGTNERIPRNANDPLVGAARCAKRKMRFQLLGDIYSDDRETAVLKLEYVGATVQRRGFRSVGVRIGAEASDDHGAGLIQSFNPWSSSKSVSNVNLRGSSKSGARSCAFPRW